MSRHLGMLLNDNLDLYDFGSYSKTIIIHEDDFRAVEGTSISVIFDWITDIHNTEILGVEIRLDDLLPNARLTDRLKSLKYISMADDYATIWFSNRREGRNLNCEAFEAFFYLSDDMNLFVAVPMEPWISDNQADEILTNATGVL